ncbi:cytochrome P450 [Daedaleopsis nitida]|nr:cytochrome P450 [Daedaleopsis nitida]
MLPDATKLIAFSGLAHPLLWILAPVVLYFLTRAARSIETGKPSTPPGPKPLPILGNLLSLSRKKPWEAFAELGKKYGDVVYLQILGRPIIILNSVDAVNDLLEGRAEIYSCRPVFPIMHIVGHDQWNFSFMPYSKRSRTLRRAFLEKYSTPTAMRSFYDAQRAVGIKFLSSVLRDPDSIFRHVALRASRLILDVTYGIEVESNQDPFVKTAEAVMATSSLALSAVMWFFNPMTILKYIPDRLGGSALPLKWQADCNALRYKPYAHVQNALAQGLARPSYVASLIQEMSPQPGSDEEAVIRDTAAIAYGAASDTIIVTSETFLLAMVLNPDVQRRAQEEIDRVVGSERLPDYADRAQLPYISAVLKEVIRWHPAGPAGVPHMLTQDDVYKGYHIPAGAMVSGNIWGLLHDPERYPDPMEFRPERFLRDGVFDCSTNDPSRYAFGFGRRACPGRLFAEDSVWMLIAQFLTTFTASVPEGADPPTVEFTTQSASRPLPFKCVVRPRSQAAVDLIESVMASLD